ncbi:hypothetical protein F5Y17DRAFT_433281 [Xylariaceae sp. FL0594]|nr:hypothetical protein F5Y17DRAFT_433281 [Xylariaceae sp. FL0594]
MFISLFLLLAAWISLLFFHFIFSDITRNQLKSCGPGNLAYKRRLERTFAEMSPNSARTMWVRRSLSRERRGGSGAKLAPWT